MRPILTLVLGLLLGAIGATLFRMSLPSEEGTPEEKMKAQEVSLKDARREIAGLREQLGMAAAEKPGGSMRDQTRRIARDIRDGRDVSVNDVFDATKPLMRDIGPLLARMGQYEQEEHFESLAGEMARTYDLSDAQQKELQKYLKKRAKSNSDYMLKVMTSPTTTLRDYIRAQQDVEDKDGLDTFMETALKGEKREQFKKERLLERVERVQAEADRNVNRLDRIVELDEEQKDSAFLLMARGSRHFDPAMQIEGLESNPEPIAPGVDRREAMLQLLRPEQRKTYEDHAAEQRKEAEEGLRAIGLTLPDDWDVLEEGSF